LNIEVFAILGVKGRRNISLWINTIFAYIVITSAAYLIVGTGFSLIQLRENAQEIYRVTDNFFGDSASEFYGRPNNVEVLQELNYWLNNHEDFFFMNFGRHHIGIDYGNLLFPERLTIEYELGIVTYDGFRSYNSIQVGSRFLDYFSFEAEDGRLFEPSDFSIHNDIVPILFGSEYQAYVSLGDVIYFWLVGYDFIGEVVGFLREGTYYNNPHDLISTDRLIVVPAQVSEEPLSNENRNLALHTYLNHVSGLISSDLPRQTIQNLITQKSTMLNIPPYSLEQTVSLYLTMWGMEGEQLQATIAIAAILMIVITGFSISIVIISRIHELKRDIAIYIACGLSHRSLKYILAVGIGLINLLSAAVGVLILGLFTGNLYWLPVLIVVGTNISAQCYQPIKLISSLQISSAMNGE